MTYRQTNKPRWPEQAGCSATLTALARRVHFLLPQGKSTPPKGVQGGPPTSSAPSRPTFRPLGKPAGSLVSRAISWVWRGRGTVRGTGNWGAGVGSPTNFSSCHLLCYRTLALDTLPVLAAKLRAAAENWLTHRSRAPSPLPALGREQGSGSGAGEDSQRARRSREKSCTRL